VELATNSWQSQLGCPDACDFIQLACFLPGFPRNGGRTGKTPAV